MKRLLIIIWLGMTISFSMQAQNLESAINASQEVTNALRKDIKNAYNEYQNYLDSINIVNALIENLIEQNYSIVEKELKKYDNFIDMCKHIKDINPKLRSQKDNETAVLYLFILKATNSLCEIYDKKDNDFYIAELKKMDESKLLNEKHQESFKDIFIRLKNYRYAIFELSRLIDQINEIKVTESKKEEKKQNQIKEIIESLRDNQETEYVDKIPYLKDCFENYVKAHVNGKGKTNIIVNLKTACPEAFN